MQRIRFGQAACIVAAAFAAVVALPRGARAQTVFSGTGDAAGADLGIGRMIAPYAIVHAAGDWIQLGGELELRDIRPNGPAAGRVNDGDVLVAVDGALITTREGSQRLFRAQTGQPLHLTLRRQGRTHDIVLVPVAGVEARGHVEQVDTSLSPATVAPSARRSDGPRFRAPGWLGIGLSCKCTMQTAEDGSEHWTFGAPPQVAAVEEGGPAAQGGIAAGDIVESVNGVAVTTPEGGRRWSAIVPGQRVRLAIRRGHTNIDLVVLAADR